MSRDYRVYLEDILEAVSKIRQFTAGLTLATFSQDAKTLDAVVRNLEIAGEAVKHLTEDVRARYSGLDWKKIAGFRDILIHEYFGVNVGSFGTSFSISFPTLKKPLAHCSH